MGSQPSPNIDEAAYALMAIRAVTDLLSELPDMHVVNPKNLNALLSIVADRLEMALSI